MTLPTTFPLSMSQIATELGRSLPLPLLDPWILKLAGKSGAPISFSDLLGKTGRFDGNATISQAGQFDFLVALGNPAFFGGSLLKLEETGGAAYLSLVANSPYPNWTGNVFVKDNTTGQSKVLSYVGSGIWGGSGGGGAGGIGIFGAGGQTHSFTILPSS